MNVFSVIITFNPDLERLLYLCHMLIGSNVKVIIVNNSIAEISDESFKGKDIVIVELNENRGIAAAQNIGIKLALKNKADTIVFFDQDSRIDKSYIYNLLSHVEKDEPLIVAPVFFDENGGYEYPSFRFNKLGLLKKLSSINQSDPYEVDVIISSGSAATKEVFLIAGLMDEDFFIDFVDIEWSIRCRWNNIKILIVPDAIMQHSIGERSMNLWIIRVFVHSPYRSYYKLRNTFHLLRKKNIPKILAIKEISAALFHQTILLFFVKEKKEYFKSYFSAIYDGIMGVKGKKV